MGNFAFLSVHSKALAALGATAEKIFPLDPTSCVFKLRLLAEAITQDVAARVGIQMQQSTQLELLRAVDNRLGLDPQVRQMFQLLRVRGNEAAHQVAPSIGYREALESLKVAREVALWFHRTFGSDAHYRPGPFVLPDDPSQKLVDLQKQIAALQEKLTTSETQQTDQAGLARLLAQQAEQERALAAQAQEERAIYEQLAQEASDTVAQLQAELAKAQAAALASAPSMQSVRAWSNRASQAAGLVVMDEASTRLLIDQLLRDAGWEADTVQLTHAKGARPHKGRNLAISEWPTAGMQSADYVLFSGLVPVGVVEAKRHNIHVAGKIGQAERYARGFVWANDMQAAWLLEQRAEPWEDGQGACFQIPFAYSCNGRPFIKQHAESSGTWFRDLRQPSHLSKPLQGFHSPDGLLDLLRRDVGKAQALLAQEAHAYLRLRDYQLHAIQAVEDALAQGSRQCLLAMATGTGKTRTIIGLIYRLLKAERFKRILFLVDRTALGEQAQDAFGDMLLEQNQPLSKIYNVAMLGDMAAEAATRVQVATVQAMAQRIFASDTALGLDTFDCLIVDEAHRGYTLDQEMTEGELEVRDQAQYLSTYRRVLDWFDAVKIGMTATPAKHTTEIFGKPIYTYSYREAVADDWLIDHEPPIRFTTQLTQNGIHFDKGTQIESLNLRTGELDQAELDDDLHFDVGSFNKGVLNENFNRVICEELAKDFDPFGQEKTLIFCATDTHADTVVRLLHAAFEDVYGDQYNRAAVVKITGASDKVGQLIRRYKNEALPNIAVTVDLLTTGIDVPAICNLVFMRRVRSRILYEQMLGRATRLCQDIGKTVFRIYDPVDLYATLQDVNTMLPLVKDPKVSIDQLLADLDNPQSYAAPGSGEGRSHADDVLDQLGQKLMRVLRKAEHQAAKKPALKERLQQLEQSWGVAPAQLHRHLHDIAQKKGTTAAVAFLRDHTQLLQQLGQVQELMGTAYRPVLSDHADALIAREQSWGSYTRPEDYLDGFECFVREQLNQSVALGVVVNRPKDLTRAQLKEVRLLLDGAGYSEVNLQTAWRQQNNQDIAAGVVAYIRRAALGEALVPFAERVARAMQRIGQMHPWTTVQRQWLERIGKQLQFETVLDTNFINSAFAQKGGAKQVNKLLGGQLDTVVAELSDALWQKAA